MYKQIIYIIVVVLAAIGVGFCLYLFYPTPESSQTGQTMMVKVFFSNKEEDPEAFFCERVYPAEREISKPKNFIQAALEELLKGPNEVEKEEGFFTNINPGVKIQDLVSQDGKVRVDFDKTLEQGVGGSCRVAAIIAQIIETVKQFPEVKEVIISIENRTEDILQP